MQQRPVLFNHLIGACKQGRGHLKTERLGGIEIDHQLELGRLHHRQIADLDETPAPAPIVTSSVESPLGFSIVVRAIERADRGRPSPTIPWGCWIFAGRARRSRSDNLVISTTEQQAALPYQGRGHWRPKMQSASMMRAMRARLCRK